MARLSDAVENQFSVPRFDSGRADRAGPGTVHGLGAARRNERHPGMVVVLSEESDYTARFVSGARLVHSVDEAEEHLALDERRRVDHALGARVLRLSRVAGYFLHVPVRTIR